MTINSIFLGIATASFYALSTVLLALRLRQADTDKTTSVALQLSPAAVGLALHAGLLAQLIFQPGGINLGFFNSLTLFAWLIVITGMIVSIKMVTYILLIMLPVNIVTIILALAFPHAGHNIASPSIILDVHITISVLAYCMLSIAAVLAILLAVQDYQLRHRLPGKIAAGLPPLQTLESIMFKLIVAGFVLLTFSLLSGFIFTTDWFNHKIVFSCIAWLVFLVLLIGRFIAGWRGSTAIRWTLGGIISLMLAFFGTKLVLEIILNR
jgi:ABC-type uncharacterized transport system permease subunit